MKYSYFIAFTRKMDSDICQDVLLYLEFGMNIISQTRQYQWIEKNYNLFKLQDKKTQSLVWLPPLC